MIIDNKDLHIEKTQIISNKTYADLTQTQSQLTQTQAKFKESLKLIQAMNNKSYDLIIHHILILGFFFYNNFYNISPEDKFILLFPLLNDNGLYIIEDTICYKSNEHIDINYPNHLEYFFKYIPYLNQWRYDSTEGIKDHCTDPFKINKKTTNPFEYSIDKIEYGCSYIAISKKIRTHWIK
jgi:hypothetical protein